MRIFAVVIFASGSLSGVVRGDPLREEPRTFLTGKPTIDFGSCPDAKVVQNFNKNAVS